MGNTKRFRPRGGALRNVNGRTIVVISCARCSDPLMVPSDAALRVHLGESKCYCERCSDLLIGYGEDVE
jgi:hypothetical protein